MFLIIKTRPKSEPECSRNQGCRSRPFVKFSAPAPAPDKFRLRFLLLLIGVGVGVGAVAGAGAGPKNGSGSTQKQWLRAAPATMSEIYKKKLSWR